MCVQLERRADLLDAAGRKHRDAVGQRHRLDLIVGHVDHRRLQVFVQLGELVAHAHAQRGVEVRERLVEQKHRRLAHDRAADRNPLALATRQVFGFAVEQVFDVQNFCGVVDQPIDLGPRHLAEREAEGHVLAQVHVRVERVRLKHHRDAALGGRHVIDDAAGDGERARGDVFEAGDRPQQGRLAASRGADEHHEFAVTNLEVDAVQDAGVAIRFADSGQLHFCHVRPPRGAVFRRGSSFWCLG